MTASLLLAGQAHALSTPAPRTPTPPPPTATPIPLPTRQQTAELDVQCKFPLIGTRAATLLVGTYLPESLPLNTQYDARIGFSLLFNGSSGLTGGAAHFVNGSFHFDLATTSPNGDTWPTIGGGFVTPTPYFDGSEQVAIGGTSAIPIYPTGSGDYVLRQETIDLNLVAYADEARTEIVTLPPASTDVDGNPVGDSDGNPNTFDVRCKLPGDPAARKIATYAAGGPTTPTPFNTNTPTPTPTVEVTPTPLPPSPTPGGDPYLARPTTPGVSPEATDFDVTSNSIVVRWVPSSATSTQSTVSGYLVKVNGEPQPDPGLTDRLVLNGLQPDTDYEVAIAGHTYYAVSETLTLHFHTKPAGGGTPTPVLTPIPEPGTPYPSPVPTLVPDPGTPYPSPVPTLVPDPGTPYPSPLPRTPVPTSPPSAQFAYALQGSTTLATLTKGTMPLTGSVDASLVLATGDFTADLKLNDTQGRLTALGFLPVTATVGFVTSGPTTGKLVDDALTTNSKVRIKIKSVKAFGAIPLAGGNTCQTKSLSDISLASTDAFDPTTRGGTIGGTYAISDLNGCGPLNGLVSPITAGKGNTISVRLTPTTR